MENTLISIDDSGKEWTLLGNPQNWEYLFMDDSNFIPILNFCRDKARNLVADVHTKDGLITIKTIAKQIGRVQKFIEERGMEVAKELKAKPKIVDATRKRVKDTLIMYKDEVLAPLKEIEAREALCDELANLPQAALGANSTAIGMLIEDLQARAHLDDNLYPLSEWWQETHSKAVEVYNKAFTELDKAFNEAVQKEKDAKELERLRNEQSKQAQEAKAKAESAERAQLEAEAKAKAAEERAKKAEELAAKLKAEQEAHEREMEELKAKTLEERKMLRRGAVQSLMKELECDEDYAKKIVTLIHKGLIHGVKMDY